MAACLGVDPCPEHAVVSVKFAQDCIVHMLELTAQLAFELGPDTEDLAMRFGVRCCRLLMCSPYHL